MTRDEMIKIMIDMWNNGKTGAEIAKEVGKTRNSVMGLLQRLRIKGFLQYKKTADRNDEQIIHKIVLSRKNKQVTIADARLPITKPIVLPRKKLMKPPGITLLELNIDTCRYILDTPQFEKVFYCGEQVEHGSYCAKHGALCYVKPYKEQVRDSHDYSIKSYPTPIYTEG